MFKKLPVTIFVTNLGLNGVWILLNSLLIEWYDVPFRTIISFSGPVVIHAITFFVALYKHHRTPLNFILLLLAFISIHFGTAALGLVGVMSLHWPAVILPIAAFASLVLIKIVLEPYFQFSKRWFIVVTSLTALLAVFIWAISMQPIALPRVPLIPFVTWQLVSSVVLASMVINADS